MFFLSFSFFPFFRGWGDMYCKILIVSLEAQFRRGGISGEFRGGLLFKGYYIPVVYEGHL